MIDQFVLEVKLQSFLNHPNITSIYHQFDDKNHIYLVLEYMEQGTLFSQLKKTKILKESDVATKIRQIASAVNYLHENYIAHRDIKPENIVMSNVFFLYKNRVYASYVISVGQPSVSTEDQLIVAHSIMLLLKY